MSTKVLLVGASGFVGGTILYILSQPEYVSKYDVTAVVRGKDDAAKVQEAFPASKVVVGSFDDLALIEELSATSHAVINAATCDHLEGAAAIITGLKKQKQESGRVGVFVHISGAGSIMDDAKGLYTSTKIFEDVDLTEFWDLPDTVLHRPVDKFVADAGSDVRALIACPTSIYGGVGKGAVKRVSMAFPPMIRAALKIGQAGYLGEGLAIHSSVHVQDVADFALFLLDLGLKNDPRLGSGRDAFWFVETDSVHTGKETAAAFGRRLFERGLIANENPRPWTEDEKAKHFTSWVDVLYGTNMRCKGMKAHELGWKPKYGTGRIPMLSQGVLDAEIDAVL